MSLKSEKHLKHKLSLLEIHAIALFRTVTNPEFLKVFKGIIISRTVKALTKKVEQIRTSRQQTMPPEWIGYQTADRIIVYHEADRAGPHIESYLVINGTAYNIGVKRLQDQHISKISKNNSGKLTNNSKQFLLNLLTDEYKKGAWLAQTTDHAPNEARMAWVARVYDKGYGAGEMREVLLDSPVSVFKTGNTIEYRDWTLNPDSNSYVFGLMEPKDGVRKGRILKLGVKTPNNPTVKDRLHLKPHIGTENFDRFKDRVGPNGIVTIKLDGASCYWEISPKGMQFWSPRVSKVTGSRIDYNAKVGNLIHTKLQSRASGMGELNYIDTKTGRVLSSAETGGILNSNSPVPKGIKPVVTIYRVDKLNRKDIHNYDYNSQLFAIEGFASLHPDLRTPNIVTWDQALEAAKHHEGLVGIPEGASILNGHKYKPRHDSFDWEVTRVELEPGDKGGLAGVVWFKAESGKEFKIGASSLGSREFAENIMEHPKKYIGRVAKISGYKGHEGRAARFVEWHDSKGEM